MRMPHAQHTLLTSAMTLTTVTLLSGAALAQGRFQAPAQAQPQAKTTTTAQAKPGVAVNPKTVTKLQVKQPAKIFPGPIKIVNNDTRVLHADVTPIRPQKDGVKISAVGARETVTSVGPHGYFIMPTTSASLPSAFVVLELPPSPTPLTYQIFCDNWHGLVVAQAKNSTNIPLASPEHLHRAWRGFLLPASQVVANQPTWIRIYKTGTGAAAEDWSLVGCYVEGIKHETRIVPKR